MTSNARTFLDPRILDQIAGLELKARSIVEGYVSGLHRSPFHGFSVEFAEHREYVPGDDIRFLDWKVYGKTDRLYIKRYEEETNLEAWLVVDASASMAYASRDGKGPSKFDYASWCAAALGYLITQQQDAAGLVLFDDEVRRTLPAQSNAAHLRTIITAARAGATRSRHGRRARLVAGRRGRPAPRHHLPLLGPARRQPRDRARPQEPPGPRPRGAALPRARARRGHLPLRAHDPLRGDGGCGRACSRTPSR